ncbi:hypothetical protein WG66_003453 [Moniliophthora roreri]|uniref:Uncharacterized protein n=1 Tax=Moniliophthora roreri TaxID=221103 RepID=A0A0W0G362_MONRR|nr:hypothetical protein WG66_003453 [Moniliophthora roreri]
MQFSVSTASFILAAVSFARATPHNVFTTVATNETITAASNSTVIFSAPTATVNVTCDPAAPTKTTTYDSFTITYQDCTVIANVTQTACPTGTPIDTITLTNNTLTIYPPTATVNATCNPAAPTQTTTYDSFTITYQDCTVTGTANATATVNATATPIDTVTFSNHTLTSYLSTATVNVTCDPAAPTKTTTYDSFTITYQDCTVGVTATATANATANATVGAALGQEAGGFNGGITSTPDLLVLVFSLALAFVSAGM